MTDWAALRKLAESVDGCWMQKAPGDVPIATCGGTVQVCAEAGGYDVWHIGDRMSILAINVSREVAAAYLKEVPE